MNFSDRLIKAIDDKQNPSCVGLDQRILDIPEEIRKEAEKKYGNNFQGISYAIVEFNKRIIDSIKDIVPVVKPQISFYECYGSQGMEAFIKTINYAKKSKLIVIADVKRNDIGSTAEAYAYGFLGHVPMLDGTKSVSIDADSITVNPYLGSDGIRPFVEACKDFEKGIFILCKTSNPSSSEIQDKIVEGKSIYEIVAEMINNLSKGTQGNSGYNSIGAVVGATYPEQAKKIRSIIPKSFFLVPGYGAQGGSAKNTTSCFNNDGYGAIINSSRDIIFAYKKIPNKKFDEASRIAAEKMKEDISKSMKEEGIYPW